MLGRNKAPIWLVVATLILGAGAHAQTSTVDNLLLDGVAAHVNKHVITIGDVLMLMEPARRELIGKATGSALRERLQIVYQDTLNGLVERFIVLDAYELGEGRIPEWAINKRAEEVIRESFSGDRQVLLDALADEDMTYDDWKLRITQQMIVASMRGASVDQNVEIPPQTVMQYYKDHLESFQAPEQVQVQVIVVHGSGGTNDAGRTKADHARQRVEDGEDFGAVARTVSEGMRSEEGGDWGWVKPSSLRPELVTALDALDVGSVSAVVPVEDDYYLVKLNGRQEARTQDFTEVEIEIQNRLRQERAQAMYKAWVERLKQNAYVRVFDADLF